jgi:maltose/maltodextrin transport system substrate-binding protein
MPPQQGVLLMKRAAYVLLLCLSTLLFLSACGKKEEKTHLVVWTDMNETKSLNAATARFTARTGVPVKIVRVPLIELQPKFQVAAPVRQGPDLVTGPHNWVGPFATAGLISPVELTPDEATKYLPVSLKVMSFEGKIYGLPVSVEAPGLIYNKKFVSKPPQTMKELIAIAQEIDSGKYGDVKGFMYEMVDFYFSWAFFGGYGAYIFKDTPQGLDPKDVGLDSPEAVQAAQLILDFIKKYHLMEQGVTKDIADGRFLDNKLAMTYNGPWTLVNYKKQGISYGFAPLPKLDNGRYPSPLVSVLGVMLNRETRHRELAIDLMKEICSGESQIDIYLEGGRIPSRLDAQDDPRLALQAVLKENAGPGGDAPDAGAAGGNVSGEPDTGYRALSTIGGLSYAMDVTFVPNEEVKGILESARVGTPMPNIPAFTQVWQPMKEALQLITMEKQSPEEALKMQVDRIRKDITRMMR